MFSMAKIYGHTPNDLFRSYNFAISGTALPEIRKGVGLPQYSMKITGKFYDIKSKN